MSLSPSNPMRATAATLTLAMALMGAAPTLAFCQAMCLTGEAPTAHHSAPAPAHHHLSHAARSHATDVALKDNAACKSLIQVALLRRQDPLATDRQVEVAAPADAVSRLLDLPSAPTSSTSFPDRQSPPGPAQPVVPLRV